MVRLRPACYTSRVRPAALCVALVAFAGCAATPYTNRTQLMLVSPQEEAALGARAFQGILKQARLDDRASVRGVVEEVGWQIARAANRPDYAWHFVVIDDPRQVNAFCLPGGKVGVYTGLFPVAKTRAGLAVVIGHEVAHAIARHGAERMSQGLVAQLGGAVLGSVIGPGSEVLLAAYGLGAEVGVLLPFGRAQESEADHIGLVLMTKAGYDPAEALPFWKRMEQASRGEGGGPPAFLSTHPSHGERERQIAAWLPEMASYQAGAPEAPDGPLPVLTASAR